MLCLCLKAFHKSLRKPIQRFEVVLRVKVSSSKQSLIDFSYFVPLLREIKDLCEMGDAGCEAARLVSPKYT